MSHVIYCNYLVVQYEIASIHHAASQLDHILLLILCIWLGWGRPLLHDELWLIIIASFLE